MQGLVLRIHKHWIRQGLNQIWSIMLDHIWAFKYKEYLSIFHIQTQKVKTFHPAVQYIKCHKQHLVVMSNKIFLVTVTMPNKIVWKTNILSCKVLQSGLQASHQL